MNSTRSERRIRGFRVRPPAAGEIVAERMIGDYRVVAVRTPDGECVYDVLIREDEGWPWWGISLMSRADARRVPKRAAEVGTRLVAEFLAGRRTEDTSSASAENHK
jgi:hypothetical protein